MLIGAASGISCARAVEVVKSFGGICYPAHIDRSSFSILSNLGTIDESFGFTCAEIFDLSKEEELKQNHPYLNNLKIISDSDAHYLENMRIPKDCYLEVESKSVEAILAYFK